MSRPPPSKSRGEKTGSRGAAGAQSVAATVPVSNEIIPGRLTETEWLRLMSEDDDSSFIGNIVDDLIEHTLEKCYEKYIWNQLIPYTVDHSKNAILRIVEWHFLSRDVGEKNIAQDEGWKEDSEPEAGVIDSWAQGSVPVVVRPQSSLAPSVSVISESVQEPPHPPPVEDSIGYGSEPPMIIIEHSVEEEEEPEKKLVGQIAETEVKPEKKLEDQITATAVEEAKVELEEKLVDQITKTEVKPEEKLMQPKPPEVPKKIEEAPVDDATFNQDTTELTTKKKRRVYKKHTGRLPPLPKTDFDTLDGPKVEEKKEESPVSEKSEMHLSPSQKSLIKSQAGRPPGNREVTFDEKGNVVGVMKLNVQTLPTHKVRVQYTVIDPLDTKQKTGVRLLRNQKESAKKADKSSTVSKSIGSKYRSETSSSYKTRDLGLAVQQFPPGMESLVRGQKGSKASVREKKVRGARIDPLPPLLIEAIDAAPGVVIQEGEHVKKGPEEAYPNNITRAIGKSSTIGQGPKLRLVGDRVFQSKLRPIFDPSDVVEIDSKKQNIFAVTSGIQQRAFEQTTES